MKSVLFWTTGNNDVGYGHLSRCITLASYLRESFDISFVMVDASPFARELLASEHFSYTEPLDFYESLKGKKNVVVVLDLYKFSDLDEVKIKNKGYRVLTISDLSDRNYASDIVVNHNPYARDLSYKVGEGCGLILGSDFALIKPAFYHARRTNLNLTPHFSKVVFCLGGGFDLSFPRRVIAQDWFAPIAQTARITIINRTGEKVQDEHKITYKSMMTPAELAIEFSSADLIVTTASVTALEVAAIGCPMITCVVADNQILMNAFLEKNGLAKSVGDIRTKIDFSNVEKTFNFLSDLESRKKMVRLQTGMLDGKASERYITLFKSL